MIRRHKCHNNKQHSTHKQRHDSHNTYKIDRAMHNTQSNNKKTTERRESHEAKCLMDGRIASKCSGKTHQHKTNMFEGATVNPFCPSQSFLPVSMPTSKVTRCFWHATVSHCGTKSKTGRSLDSVIHGKWCEHVLDPHGGRTCPGCSPGHEPSR